MRFRRPTLALMAALILGAGTFACTRTHVRAAGSITYSIDYVDNLTVTINGRAAVEGGEYGPSDIVAVGPGLRPGGGSFGMSRTEQGWTESSISADLTAPVPLEQAWCEQAVWTDYD